MQALAWLQAVALLGPAAVAGLWAAGLPVPFAVASVSVAGAVVLLRTGPALGAALRTVSQAFGAVAPVVVVAGIILAAFYQVQLSRFIIDPSRGDLSVFPGRKFFREHSCLSSYTEAARFADAGRNIYQIEQYVDVPKPGEFRDRHIGPLVVDIYQYPPAFLLLPGLAGTARADFFAVRAAWFLVQCGLLYASMFALACWVGGRPGMVALLLVPFLWIAPTTRVTLQIGNFQVTAFSLGVLAMLAFERSRHLTGGLTLGFAAISKIFPGMLGILLLAARRWRPVVWTAAAGVALTAAAWAVVGSKPFADFLTFQLPRIESGDAFFWIEDPAMAPVNQSVYGLVTKLRLLGLPMTGQQAAARASSAYAALLFVLAAYAGWRLSTVTAASELSRLRAAQVWLALLSLGSFRSPFVPDAYGLIGTLWLVSLIAAGRAWPIAAWLGFAAAAVAFSVVLDGGLVPDPVPAWLVLVTLAIQLWAIGLNAAAVVRRIPHI